MQVGIAQRETETEDGVWRAKDTKEGTMVKGNSGETVIVWVRVTWEASQKGCGGQIGRGSRAQEQR